MRKFKKIYQVLKEGVIAKKRKTLYGRFLAGKLTKEQLDWIDRNVVQL